MISGKIYRFRTDESLMDPRFLELFLLSPDAQKSLDAMKTGISDSGLNLTQSRFLELGVVVPELGEQRRIVDILEDHLSRLDAAQTNLGLARSRSEGLLVAALLGNAHVQAAPTVPLSRLLAESLANGRSVPTREGGFPVLRLTALKAGAVDLAERKGGAWTEADAKPFLVQRGDYFV